MRIKNRRRNNDTRLNGIRFTRRDVTKINSRNIIS
jgi:hypothetical protein